jgi:hypothetical protein
MTVLLAKYSNFVVWAKVADVFGRKVAVLAALALFLLRCVLRMKPSPLDLTYQLEQFDSLRKLENNAATDRCESNARYRRGRHIVQ